MKPEITDTETVLGLQNVTNTTLFVGISSLLSDRVVLVNTEFFLLSTPLSSTRTFFKPSSLRTPHTMFIKVTVFLTAVSVLVTSGLG